MGCRMFCEQTMENIQLAQLFFFVCELNKNREPGTDDQFPVDCSKFLLTLPSPTLPDCGADPHHSRDGRQCDRPITAWAQFPESAKDLRGPLEHRAHGQQLP